VDATRKLKVMANADSPEDAAMAAKNGAEGIGLCRTEHMFFNVSTFDFAQLSDFVWLRNSCPGKESAEGLLLCRTDHFFVCTFGLSN